ncbi:MAG TPA: FUSC family membrane protein [Salinimicrobium sp.]|nr:FUSC family membrane protein [Salinimicrobium sp.]
MKEKLIHYQNSIVDLLKGFQFLKAVLLTVGVISALLIFNAMGYQHLGISVTIGVLFSSASDVPGPLFKKVGGILLSTIIAAATTLIVSFASVSDYILIPVFLIVVFLISFLAVYGFRASLISFAGLFAAVLALPGLVETSIWIHAAFIAIGGLWYLLLSLLLFFFNPKKQEDYLLAECFALTADYIKTRAKLLARKENRRELIEKQLFLQKDLNEKHESLRELLISSRKTSGFSNSSTQKLYIFIELLDILELAMANPVNYEKMDWIFENEKNLLKSFEFQILAMADHLRLISNIYSSRRTYQILQPSKTGLDKIKSTLQNSKSRNIREKENENLLILHNMYDYQEKQYEKIAFISQIVANKNLILKEIQRKEAGKFLSPKEYSFSILLDNFNLKSPIFRHSLRLTVVILLGIIIGEFFHLEKVYWILFAIIVILRPNYGLTKQRSKERILGTIIGAVVAAGIVYFIQDLTVYAVLAAISFLLAFSLVQKNYKWSAAFITLNVVFIYALLSPDAFNLIQYRVLDTAIGAVLAFMGILFFWPSWESAGMEKLITESIEANQEYLKEIAQFYREKDKVPTSYKLSRKRAFLAMGNLSAAFQRMTQEPKFQQKDIGHVYELVVLNQTFLSSLASLGTYIQHHATTPASSHFESLVLYIQHNLNLSVANLKLEETKGQQDEESLVHAQNYLESKFRSLEKEKEDSGMDNNLKGNLQELQLVSSQLKWLLDVSQKLQKNTNIQSV